MGRVKRMYRVTLKSGAVKEVIREEKEDRTLIGLWVWSQRQRDEVFINVEEGVIKASEIAMVDNPVEVDKRDPDTGYYQAVFNRPTTTLPEVYAAIKIYKKLLDKTGLDEPTSYGVTLEQEIEAAEEEIK